jgi:hypothetical protein
MLEFEQKKHNMILFRPAQFATLEPKLLTIDQRRSVFVGQIKLSHSARMRLFTQWLPW